MFPNNNFSKIGLGAYDLLSDIQTNGQTNRESFPDIHDINIIIINPMPVEGGGSLGPP